MLGSLKNKIDRAIHDIRADIHNIVSQNSQGYSYQTNSSLKKALIPSTWGCLHAIQLYFE